MKDITLGQFYPVESPIHSLDPRTKILCTIVLVVFVFLCGTFVGFGVSALFIVLVACLAHIPLKNMLKGLKAVYFLLIFTFVLNIFFYSTGNVLIEVWFIRITDGGLIRAAFMALRLMLLVTGAGLLTLTTSPIELTDGIESLLSPLKIIGFPAHEIAMMMSIALRFIPTLTEETDKIMKAQAARGAVFDEGGLVKLAKAVVPLLIPLFVSAFRRAEELAMAMEARCYHGGEGRTRLKILKFQYRDLAAVGVMLLFVAAILADKLILANILPYLAG